MEKIIILIMLLSLLGFNNYKKDIINTNKDINNGIIVEDNERKTITDLEEIKNLEHAKKARTAILMALVDCQYKFNNEGYTDSFEFFGWLTYDTFNESLKKEGYKMCQLDNTSVELSTSKKIEEGNIYISKINNQDGFIYEVEIKDDDGFLEYDIIAVIK